MFRGHLVGQGPILVAGALSVVERRLDPGFGAQTVCVAERRSSSSMGVLHTTSPSERGRLRESGGPVVSSRYRCRHAYECAQRGDRAVIARVAR